MKGSAETTPPLKAVKTGRPLRGGEKGGARPRGRGALWVLLLISLWVGAVGAYRWALETPYFRLREVALEGFHHLSRSVVLGRLGLPEGANLLALDLKDLRRKLEGHPWVRSAALGRELPGRLRVEIRERRPAAVLQGLLLDQEGVVLGRAGESSERYPILLAAPPNGASLGDSPEGAELPGVEGLPVGLEVLRLFEVVRPTGVQVRRVDLREGRTLTVDVKGKEGQTTRLRLAGEDLRQGLRRFGALLFLWEKGPWPQEVDLSMGPRAVAR